MRIVQCIHELYDPYESSNAFTSLKVVLPSDTFTDRAVDPWISLALLGFCLSGNDDGSICTILTDPLMYSRVIRYDPYRSVNRHPSCMNLDGRMANAKPYHREDNKQNFSWRLLHLFVSVHIFKWERNLNDHKSIVA